MRRKQWIWLIVAVLVFVGAGVTSVVMSNWSSGLLSGSTSQEEASGFPTTDFLARIDIEGTMTTSSSSLSSLSTGFDEDYIIDLIERLIPCSSNVGILLYIDSGGGEVAAADAVYLKLLDYKMATGRPIYAFFDGTACSGAYYVAMAADEIWADRNCMCVNIGVYISTYNLSGLFDDLGIEQVMIRSSDNKGIGAVGIEWTDEQLEIYQSMVDLYYEQFLEVVASGRDMTVSEVKAGNDGREMLASQALEAGFIDGISRYEEYEAQLLSYYHESVQIYQESRTSSGLFASLFGSASDLAAQFTTKSDGELLQEFVDQQSQIVVMAYAG